MFTCQQIYTICCYAYNNKLKGRLYCEEGRILSEFYRSTNVYEYSDTKCWFNPLKPSDKKLNLSGYFNFDNEQ